MQYHHGSNPLPKIKLVHVISAHGSGNIKATATIVISTDAGDLVIHGFRVIQNGTHRAWCSVPQTQWESEGKVVFQNLVEMPPTLLAEVRQSILTAWLGGQSA